MGVGLRGLPIGFSVLAWSPLLPTGPQQRADDCELSLDDSQYVALQSILELKLFSIILILYFFRNWFTGFDFWWLTCVGYPYYILEAQSKMWDGWCT